MNEEYSNVNVSIVSTGYLEGRKQPFKVVFTALKHEILKDGSVYSCIDMFEPGSRICNELISCGVISNFDLQTANVFQKLITDNVDYFFDLDLRDF